MPHFRCCIVHRWWEVWEVGRVWEEFWGVGWTLWVRVTYIVGFIIFINCKTSPNWTRNIFHSPYICCPHLSIWKEHRFSEPFFWHITWRRKKLYSILFLLFTRHVCIKGKKISKFPKSPYFQKHTNISKTMKILQRNLQLCREIRALWRACITKTSILNDSEVPLSQTLFIYSHI